MNATSSRTFRKLNLANYYDAVAHLRSARRNVQRQQQLGRKHRRSRAEAASLPAVPEARQARRT